MKNKKRATVKPETEIQNKIQGQTTLVIKASNTGLDIMKWLEQGVKSEIREGHITYSEALSIKCALDSSLKAIAEMQEIDARIRRLISQGNDFMEAVSNVNPFDPDRVITD